MTADATRVLCIDDNRLMAEAMERRLSYEPSLRWAGWVERSADAMPAVIESRPHVVLLDIDMPGRDSFDLVREIAAGSEARVIMFSGHVHPEYIDRAIDLGAWGYISKADTMDDVIDAIRRVAAGEFVLTPEVATEQRRNP